MSENNWRDAASLPKCPTYISGRHQYGPYVLASDGGDVVRGRWWQHESGACNFIKDGGNAFYLTHWMPLPAAPK